MVETHGDNPFERYGERWPRQDDSLFVSGGDVWIADSVGERNYRLDKGYKLAGDVLVENFLGEPKDHDNLIYPILFCYRHYIEIALKEIIEKHGPWFEIALTRRDHKLPELWRAFEQIAVAYQNDPSNEACRAVSACIDELSEYDPVSVVFRYATDRKTAALNRLDFTSIDLANLRDVMNGIANFLECASYDFDSKRDAVMEMASRL